MNAKPSSLSLFSNANFFSHFHCPGSRFSLSLVHPTALLNLLDADDEAVDDGKADQQQESEIQDGDPELNNRRAAILAVDRSVQTKIQHMASLKSALT